MTANNETLFHMKLSLGQHEDLTPEMTTTYATSTALVPYDQTPICWSQTRDRSVHPGYRNRDAIPLDLGMWWLTARERPADQLPYLPRLFDPCVPGKRLRAVVNLRPDWLDIAFVKRLGPVEASDEVCRALGVDPETLGMGELGRIIA